MGLKFHREFSFDINLSDRGNNDEDRCDLARKLFPFSIHIVQVLGTIFGDCGTKVFLDRNNYGSSYNLTKECSSFLSFPFGEYCGLFWETQDYGSEIS